MAEHILVVDDDPDALAMIRTILWRRGYTVTIAPGGAEAIESLAGDLPDLILLDLMMPVIDGEEVVRRLRAEPRTARVPVIIFTAYSGSVARAKCRQLGVDDFVSKPVRPNELVARIRATLDAAQERGAAAGKT